MTKEEAQRLVCDLRERMDREGLPMASSHVVLTDPQIEELRSKILVDSRATISVNITVPPVEVNVGIDSLLHNLCLRHDLVEPDKGQTVKEVVAKDFWGKPYKVMKAVPRD